MADLELSTVQVTVDGPVAHLTLTRPERLNALSRTTLRELAVAAHWMDDRLAIKAAVVHSLGRAFSAGFDLDDFANADPDTPPLEAADLGRQMAEAVTNTRAVTDAAEAHALHFLNRIVPADDLLATADALAASPAAKSSLTLVQTKRHVNAVAESMGSTAFAGVDALALQAALGDPESREVGRAYMRTKKR